MKITLSQDEIEQAVRQFVSKGMTLNGGSEMVIEFSMGRGENGLSASIDVPYMGVSSLPVGNNAPTTQAVPQKAAPAQVTKTVLVTEAPAAEATPVEAEAETPAADTEQQAPATAASGKSLFGTTGS